MSRSFWMEGLLWAEKEAKDFMKDGHPKQYAIVMLRNMYIMGCSSNHEWLEGLMDYVEYLEEIDL